MLLWVPKLKHSVFILFSLFLLIKKNSTQHNWPNEKKNNISLQKAFLTYIQIFFLYLMSFLLHIFLKQKLIIMFWEKLHSFRNCTHLLIPWYISIFHHNIYVMNMWRQQNKSIFLIKLLCIKKKNLSYYKKQKQIQQYSTMCLAYTMSCTLCAFNISILFFRNGNIVLGVYTVCVLFASVFFLFFLNYSMFIFYQCSFVRY